MTPTPEERAERLWDSLEMMYPADTDGSHERAEVAKVASAIRDAETAAVARERERCEAIIRTMRPPNPESAWNACGRMIAAIREGREP